jgi:cytochrome c556
MLIPRWFLLAYVFAAGTFCTAAWCIADDDQNEDEAVEHLMEKVHEGKKSPYRQLEKNLQAERPDWGAIAETLPTLQKMANLLKDSRVADIRDSSDGYRDAVKQLTQQTQEKNLAQARKALEALKNSCADCHFKGGVGGKL